VIRVKTPYKLVAARWTPETPRGVGLAHRRENICVIAALGAVESLEQALTIA